MMVPSEITKALKDPRATQIAGLWHKIIKTVLLLDRKKKKKKLARTSVYFLHLTAEDLPYVPGLL